MYFQVRDNYLLIILQMNTEPKDPHTISLLLPIGLEKADELQTTPKKLKIIKRKRMKMRMLKMNENLL